MLFGKLIISLIIGVISGFLGAWGGADNTSLIWRRVIMPIVLTIFGILVNWNLWFILTMLYFLPLTQGYGIPWGTPDTTGIGDRGSFLGRLWYKIINENNNWVEEANTKLVRIGVRGTIGLMEMFVFIWVMIIKHNWIIYLICALGIIFANVIIGGYNLGSKSFKFLKKDLSYNEFYLYLAIAVFVSILLIF